MKQGQKLTETTGNVTKTRGFQKGQKLTETTPKSTVDIFVRETLSNPNKVFKQSVTSNPIPHVNPTIEEKEPNLLEKVYIESAKKKQSTGDKLNVPEITTMAKYGVDEVKNPKNISQAINFKRELDYKDLEKFEKAVQQSDDFYSVLSGEKNESKEKKGFFEKFIDDYNTDKSNSKSKGDTTILDGDGIFKYLLPNENRIYRYLVNKGEGKKAREYINAKRSILETRKAEDVSSDRKGVLGFIKNTADAYATGVQSGLANMARMGVAGNIAAGNNMGVLNELLQPNYSEKLFSEIRNQHGNKNKIYEIVLDVANNIGAQTPQIAFGAVGGTGAYLTTMAQQIMGSDTTEAINEGYDGIKGIIYGAFDTALEYGTEYFLGGIASKINGGETSVFVKKALGAIDKAVANKKVANALAKVVVTVSGANAEGTEEFLQSLIEPVLRNIIYGENNQYSADTFAEAVNAYIVGAVSGGIMSIPYTGANLVNTRLDIAGDFIKKNSGVDSVLSLAEVTDNKSELYEQIKSENEAGRNVSNTELAELFYQSVEKFKTASKEMAESFASKNVDKLIELAKNSNLNDPEPTGTDVNTTGTDAEPTGTEGATEPEDDNSVLHEPSVKDIATKLDMFDTYKGSDGEQHMKTSRHKHIESTVEKTGAKLIWSSNVSRGKYIPSTKTIMLNPEMNTAEAYNFVLKHEFTHHLESKKGYDGFKDYAFNNSQFFEDWARTKLDDMGIDSTGSKKQIVERLTELYYNKWVSSDELSEYLRKKFTLADAEEEILADFVGENLLGPKDKLDETLHMLSDLKRKNRSIFEKIRDFIRDLIHKFKGDKSFNGLVNDLKYLNDRLERLAQSEENKKTSATEGDVKYSFAGEKAKTAEKTLLESAKERIENSEDSETVRRETGWFKGYDGKWRFEISDREAELNDKPDFEVKGDNSSGYYRVATLDEVLKHEDLLKAYPELKDYTVIVQETNPGTRGSFFAGDHQIVLSNTLFRKESEKYKNSVNEKYEEIRKIEQSPEFKEYNKFYDDRELAKIDAEQWLVLEKEAEKKFYSSEIGKRYYKLKWGKSEVPRYELGWSEAAKSVLMHEIQHAVQDIEGFAGGSSREYWGNKLLKDTYKKTTKAREKLFETKSDSDLAEIVYLYEEYIDRLGRNGKISSSEFAKAYDKFEKEIIGEEAKEAFLDFSEAVENYYQLKSEIPAKSSSMYMRTAGELEARDVSKRLDMTAKERKNTRPDIDRTDVVFADGGVSYSFNGDNISDNDSKQVINIIRNNINKISDKTVFNEKSVDIRNYDKKSDYVLDVFNKQGNVAINKVIGKIELVKSGAKSTMLHGYGKNKIAAIPAIKTIIENGDIISYTKNYTDYYDRYVIAAKGIIDGKPAVVGVVINSYNNNGSNKFYLHEVEIIEAESSSMTGSQNSEDTVNNSASNNKISQTDTVVKNNISENTEKYSENAQNTDEKLPIPLTETDKLLDKYDKGEITREEYNRKINYRINLRANEIAKESKEKVKSSKKRVKRYKERTAEAEERVERYKDRTARYMQAAEKYIADWEKKNGALMRRTIEANEIRAEAVANERKEQAIRKDRESSIYFIRRSVKRLDRALRANSKAKHIPESLKGAVTEFCRLFAENDTATFERKDLAEIASYYKQFGEEKTDRMKYDPFILASLESLGEILPGKKLTELDKYELEVVRNISDALNNAVKKEETIFLDGKQAKLEAAGIETLKAIPVAKRKLPKLKTDYFFVGNAKPFYFFKNMPGPLGKVFRDFLDGQDKFALNMDYSREFIKDTKANYSYNTWKNQTLTLETQDGKTYTITVEQAIQLVATADRQRANEVQAAEHLNVGGVLFDTELLKKVYKAQRKVKESEKSKEQKGLKAAKAELTRAVEQLQSHPIQLTFGDIDKLSKKLTENQKGYMKAIVDFLSTVCAAWGNEVTMEQYGYRQYNEANYFPYVSAKEFLYSDPAAGTDNALRHASFTNSLQRHANNPLVISSFTDVAIAHIEQMASYNAMTIPVDTLNKLFNYKTEAVPAGDGNTGIPSRSVKAELTLKFGEATVDYIENFIRDVNNGVRGDSRDSFVNAMSSKFKKTAVLGNLSVTLQQFFSIFRACADLDFKYMLKSSKYNAKNNYEEMKQFAPVATIKQMGSFDTGVGLKNSTWLSGEQTFMESLDEFLGKGAEKADEIAWSFLWSACKAEIASTTNLEVGSEEFLKAAGKRASDLINRTQVYDSVLARSQNMRNKGAAGALTSFMGEPTTIINMMYDTFTDFVQRKTSGKKVVRTVTALTSSALLTAMAQGLAYAMRDRDDDESFLEKWTYQSAANFVDNINPLSQIPYIRDIFSIWDGYDVERQDISAVADVVTAVKLLTTGEPSYYKVRKLAEAVATLFGVPVKNVLRDIDATVRTFFRMFDDNTPTAEGIKESILKGVSEDDIIAIFTGKKS